MEGYTSYTCDHCHESFYSGWTEEEAMAEAKANGFTAPFGVLCEPCYDKFMAWAQERGLV